MLTNVSGYYVSCKCCLEHGIDSGRWVSYPDLGHDVTVHTSGTQVPPDVHDGSRLVVTKVVVNLPEAMNLVEVERLSEVEISSL